ncbi:hypothetical protein DFJ74DRAFT_669243 [Hyaloraphidium curvatum]|nr:hypothetical protein DFJ74DRAFT_669243 [Hyaloraphidium curvatum]
MLLREEPSSPLVSHQRDDPLCPCPRDSCAGFVLSVMGPARLTDMVYPAALDIFCHFCCAWTALVTLGAQTWTVWWSVLFAATLIGLSIPLYCLTVQPLIVGWACPRSPSKGASTTAPSSSRSLSSSPMRTQPCPVPWRPTTVPFWTPPTPPCTTA